MKQTGPPWGALESCSMSNPQSIYNSARAASVDECFEFRSPRFLEWSRVRSDAPATRLVQHDPCMHVCCTGCDAGWSVPLGQESRFASSWSRRPVAQTWVAGMRFRGRVHGCPCQMDINWGWQPAGMSPPSRYARSAPSSPNTIGSHHVRATIGMTECEMPNPALLPPPPRIE